MNDEIRQMFEPMFFVQFASFLAVSAVFIGLAAHATRRLLRQYVVHRNETRTVIWMAVIWLVPVLGPLFALSAVDSMRAERKLGSGDAPLA